MIQVLIDDGKGVTDYASYTSPESIQITDEVNQPSTASFVLYNVDRSFKVPKRSSYVSIFSTKYNKSVFTGFIVKDCENTFLGNSSRAEGFRQISYKVTCTSDEWMLNQKMIPFIPVMVNQTIGQIIKNITQALMPNYFDVSNVADGDIVPSFTYDSRQSWSQLVKSFADALRYRIQIINRTIFFQPYGDAELGISYDELSKQSSFDPKIFKANILSIPTVNDAIMIGDTEGGNNRSDFFIGDGVTGNFPLRHVPFRGATSVLLKEDWSGTSFSPGLWTVNDSQGAFNLAGQLNVIGGPNVGVYGLDYILGTNGIELAGALHLQHGEFVFLDSSKAIVGGIYSDSTLTEDKVLAGFKITSPGPIVTPAPGTGGGASGLLIALLLNGAIVGDTWATQLNARYDLQVNINASKPSRYDRIFRTTNGTVYGGIENTANVTVTFIVTEVAVDTSNPLLLQVTSEIVLQHSVDVDLPSFAIYCPINNDFSTFVVTGTLIAKPPQTTLKMNEYTDSAGNLPNMGELPGITPGTNKLKPMGFGLDNIIASLGDAADAQVLQFYQDTIPSVGSRIHLQSWEAQAAISRVRDTNAISKEALTLGDDGVRSVIVSDLNPLPKTSEECDIAATVYISDRVSSLFDGSYNIGSEFWDGTKDYPRSGRYLYANSFIQGVIDKSLLVRSVTIGVRELADERLNFNLQFGQDKKLDKQLARFFPPKGTVLTSQDVAKPPIPQTLADVGTMFLDDLTNVTAEISGTVVAIDLGVVPAPSVEIRRADIGWGNADQNRIALVSTQTFSLSRTQFDQTFYMRMFNGTKYSRRSKVIRVYAQLVPSAPLGSIDASLQIISGPLSPLVTLQVQGDVRNIYGIEIRADDDVTVLLQRVFTSPSDLLWNYDNSKSATDVFTSGGIPTTRDISLHCYFFNLFFEYSDGIHLTANIPQPVAPVIGDIVDTDVAGTQIHVSLDTVTRNDIKLVTVQVADDEDITVNVKEYKGGGQQATFNLKTINALDKFIRAKRTDYIGDSEWSTVVSIDTALMKSSSFLNALVSVLPSVTERLTALFSYSSTNEEIDWSWAAFKVYLADGSFIQVEAGSESFASLTANKTYKFYAWITGAYENITSGTPVVVHFLMSTLGSPVGTSDDPTLVAEAHADGSLPLFVSSMTARTVAAGGSGGGSDGGSLPN